MSDRDILPDNVKPISYDISLYDLQSQELWTYQGIVKIELEIRKPTKTIVLNTHHLRVFSAELSAESGKTASSYKTSDFHFDEKNQRCSIIFEHELPLVPKALLTLTFEGTMNQKMAGFYRSRYTPITPAAKGVARDEEHHYMFSTQFESSDARQAFPCFDEPNLKATYDFEIEIPEDLTALSNMPEKETRTGQKYGYKTVRFERTPIMSTYLLAWAFGDFEYVEDFTRRKYGGKNLPVRVYTTRGLKEQGKLALESAHQIVDLYSDIFEIEYPLPKVDLLAVHEFSHGAMENWGLVTYRTTAVLFDEKTSDQRFQNRVCYVVAHELAHQWFGNLVTMDWWNELWLNEGFATWVGWYAVDHLHPEWDVWAQFVTEGMQTALSLDSLRTSHPIEVPVKNALEVDQIFDAISYLKGSSVIRMLASHIGVKTFLKGVAAYLKAHSYGNARTDDLWSALSQASGQDVKSFMDPWILKIGFPVVTVAEEPGQIILRQDRFLTSGDVKAEENETTWWVPLGVNTGAEVRNEALTAKENTLRDVDTSFYKVNANQTGFYRTNLPPQRLVQLSSQLDKLSVQDKIGLIGDAAALAISGAGTTAGVLSFVEGFSGETEYLVWSEVLTSLNKITSVFSDDEHISAGLRKFKLNLISSAAEKVGWEFKPKEGLLTGQARALLLANAGMAGHEGIVAEAQKRFAAYRAGDKSAVHPSLRSAIFRIAVKNGGKEAYEAMKDEFTTTTAIDGKDIILSAMGSVQTPELAQDYLDFGFSGKVALQDVHSVGMSIANNSRIRDENWTYLKAKWDMIYEKLGTNMVLLERYLRLVLSKYTSSEKEAEVQSFFADKNKAGYDRGLAVASNTIMVNAQYKQRDSAVVLEWLGAHGYL